MLDRHRVFAEPTQQSARSRSHRPPAFARGSVELASADGRKSFGSSTEAMIGNDSSVLVTAALIGRLRY